MLKYQLLTCSMVHCKLPSIKKHTIACLVQTDISMVPALRQVKGKGLDLMAFWPLFSCVLLSHALAWPVSKYEIDPVSQDQTNTTPLSCLAFYSWVTASYLQTLNRYKSFIGSITDHFHWCCANYSNGFQLHIKQLTSLLGCERVSSPPPFFFYNLVQ